MVFPVHTNPRRIALGISIGLMIAFSPTIGFQMGLALVAASIFNASRVAAVLSVWVTNPLTMGPVFALTYAVGRPFWFTSPDVGLIELSQRIGGGQGMSGVGAVFNAFHSIYGLGTGLYIPMLLGGVIVGAVVCGVSYFPAKSIASYCQSSLRRRSRSVRRGSSSRAYQVSGQGQVPTSKAASGRHRDTSRRRAA